MGVVFMLPVCFEEEMDAVDSNFKSSRDGFRSLRDDAIGMVRDSLGLYTLWRLSLGFELNELILPGNSFGLSAVGDFSCFCSGAIRGSWSGLVGCSELRGCSRFEAIVEREPVFLWLFIVDMLFSRRMLSISVILCLRFGDFDSTRNYSAQVSYII